MINQKSEKPAATPINHERKGLLSRYATAAICLYGVISVEEFVEVFNHYEEVHTTAKEALTVLKQIAKTDDVEYSISGNIISGPDFQPEFDDYVENVRSIRDNQTGKQKYLPDKDEFLKYVDVYYFAPKKPYDDLKEYILNHKLTTRGEGIEGVDGDLIDLRKMIQLGVKPGAEISYFTDNDYRFTGIDQANEFIKLVTEVHNNTRLYENNGFTPHEYFEKYERPKMRPLPKEPFNYQKMSEVGRNDPCPCGSGLKYKKCHGK